MSSDIKYLCVDDQEDTIRNLLDALQEAVAQLEIKSQTPKEFDAQTNEILQRHSEGELDGLLIDLRLDEPGPGVASVHYTAQGLAQQLRAMSVGDTSATRGFPIVLWSVNDRLLHLYGSDSTGHDLFDLVLHKENLEQRAIITASELVALAEGYREIAKKMADRNSFAQMVNEPAGGLLDLRVADSLPDVVTAPTHEYALHIMRFLIKRPGPLIDADYLYARLGVAETSVDLKLLVDKLVGCRYDGPFCSAWPRWWSVLVERWWRATADGSESRPLASVPASRRVEILREKLGIVGLDPAPTIEADYSTNFTTICQKLRKPLDPVNGFALAERSPKPWLEKRYVSAKVALAPARYNFRSPLDGLEKRRLERMAEAMREDVE